MDLTGNVVAMLLGVGSSATLHISQALMRLGIVRIRAGSRASSARVLYSVGLLLNFTAPLWVLVANLFADTLWFTSMFATGMVALLLFSALVLKEPITRGQTLGAVAIVAGTCLIAAAGMLGSTGARIELSLQLLLAVSLIWVLVMPLAALTVRRNGLSVQEAVFGLAAGGFLALDALWKSLAQQRLDGTVGFLPEAPEAWTYFAVSFLGAAGAFLMMQWSYWRHCRASGVVVGYNLMYVALPLALAGLLTLLQGSIPWNPLVMGGLLLMVAGALASQRQP